MKTNWNDESLAHKIVTVISVVIALSVVVLAILQIFDIWTQAINVYVPLMGVNLLCQTYMQWNTSRKTSYLTLACALFIFACAFVVFFVK